MRSLQQKESSSALVQNCLSYLSKDYHFHFRKSRILYAVFLCILLLHQRAEAQEQALIRTPKNVTVRKTLPSGVLAYGVAMPATFSKNPTDEEIYRVHFFEEPLVPAIGIKSEPEENEQLLYALAGYSQRKSPDDFSALVNFINTYPKSRWNGALLANLGVVYRRTGYYNQAMAAFQKAWDLLKDQTGKRIKPLADRAVSELLLIYAWTGRKDEIRFLLDQIDKRVMEGPAVARIVGMKEALGMMEIYPGVSFKCGPYALNKLYSTRDSNHLFNQKLRDIPSTAKGFSLTQLENLAKEIGMNYQMAFRQPGSPIIPNAVVHWKLDHYSALLNSDSNSVKCQDATLGSTYGDEFWLTPKALDSSASGYFLVPLGALPRGWHTVSESEGSKIFGKGYVPKDPGKHVGDSDMQSCPATNMPMAQSNVHLEAVSLHVFDRPLYYTPPKGPAIQFKAEYHQRETFQPSNITYSSMGPKWTFQWLSYIQDDPRYYRNNVDLYAQGGGVRTFAGYDNNTKSYDPEVQTNDVLVRTCDNCYELRHPDGSKDVYARPDGNTSKGRRVFLTQIIDVTGNTVNLFYDSLLRITALQDAIGQVTTLSYENSNDNYVITKVTDPFGRSANFEYDEQGRLDKITDMIGIISSFHYADADFIDQMTTPYGTTSFISKEGKQDSSMVETHFPMGEKERVTFKYRTELAGYYNEPIPNMPNFGHSYLVYRNTFFWDKKAMQEAPGDYNKAKIYHWLHGNSATAESGYTGPFLESVKSPYENRVWYHYQGGEPAFTKQGMSAQPAIIGRVLDDGISQLTYFSYNSLGKVTGSTDPLKREMTYTYDTSNINLLEVRQTTGNANELLAHYTYNSHHQPLAATDASGQTTHFSYNDAGQLLTVTNPKNETTTLVYDGNGYLQTIAGPVAGTTVSFTYDGYGRVHTITDPEGYTVATDYDLLDRPTVVTYPDSTYEQIVYDRMDAVKSRDRMGRWTQTVYDSLDRPTKIIDALGRINQFIWCNCGSLAQIVDPLNHITTFTRDIQGRLTAKTYNDGKTISYAYEKTTSRLIAVTDAKGQKTKYSYFLDDNLKTVSYADALVPTGSVFFTYDPNYNRVATMKDTTGTTVYAYNPVSASPILGAGRLRSTDSPLANDVITYSYDTLGRVNGRAINGVASSVEFDALGRITNMKNILGSFDYGYINQTDRLQSINMPHGLNTVFDYFDNKGDQRLKEIWNKFGNGNISKFDYEYNSQGQITKWTQQSGTALPTSYEFNYDLADQLLSAVQKKGQSPLSFKKFSYQYDSAGNRTIEQIGNAITVSEYNPLNQLTARKGMTPSRDNPSLPISNPVIIGSGQAGADTIINTPNTTIPTSTGIDTLKVNDSLKYDDNGNTISTLGTVYGWDAEDRLISITKGSVVTEFTYDGLSRRIAEKLNGVIIKQWLWDGTELAEERDAAGTSVTKRFFTQGEEVNGVPYYFMKDHLGSIREMMDSNGIVQAIYEYDPYGKKTKTYGKMDADFIFAGYYYHSASDLYLTLYRAYDANSGTWLSRDWLAEDAGLNVYSYVNKNPINLIDPLGLFEQCSCKSPQSKTYEYNGKVGLNRLGLLTNILIDKTADQFGITDLVGLGSVIAGSNIVPTRAKLKGGTPGTSLASLFFRNIRFLNKPLSKPLPTLTGFPFIGNGLKVATATTLGKFLGRTVPVVGWGLLLYDAGHILWNTYSEYEKIVQGKDDGNCYP